MAKRLSVTLDDENARTMDEFADPNSLMHGVLAFRDRYALRTDNLYDE